MRRLLFVLALLFPALPAVAQQSVLPCYRTATGCTDVSATNPLPITGSLSLAFPTIGAAVPSTGVYNGINVAGTLRGWAGLSTGSIYPGAVAIVDASGNQITTFGGAATTSNASSGVATSSTNQANVVWNYGFNGTTWDQFQVDSNKYLKVAPQAGQLGLGNVGGKTVSVCVTPTVTISNSYGTNYVIGGLLTFANAFTSTGSGILQGVVVTIHEVETSGFTFFPFSANPTATTWTDAAVAAINTADVPKTRNPVALGANSQLAASGFTVASAAGLGEALAPGTTSLYGVLIANAALTTQFAATTDVQVCIKVLDDL